MNAAGPLAADSTVVWYLRGRKTYHTKRDCRYLNMSEKLARQTTEAALADQKRVCRDCAGKVIRVQPQNWSNHECRSCGAPTKNGDDCDWCAKYEEVMGDFA